MKGNVEYLRKWIGEFLDKRLQKEQNVRLSFWFGKIILFWGLWLTHLQKKNDLYEAMAK